MVEQISDPTKDPRPGQLLAQAHWLAQGGPAALQERPRHAPKSASLSSQPLSVPAKCHRRTAARGHLLPPALQRPTPILPRAQAHRQLEAASESVPGAPQGSSRSGEGLWAGDPAPPGADMQAPCSRYSTWPADTAGGRHGCTWQGGPRPPAQWSCCRSRRCSRTPPPASPYR